MKLLPVLLLYACCLASAADAAVYNVTKTADTADGSCDADCSLREAISAANALPGQDTIILPAGIYTTTLPTTNENANANGDFDVLGDLRIIGADLSSTVVQAGVVPGVAADRVFQANAPLYLENMIVRHGRLTATSGSTLLTHGGGIFSLSDLYLKNVSVTGNECARRGGGIFSSGPNLSLDRVTVSQNKAIASVPTFGGGVHTQGSAVRIRESTFEFNEARGTGSTTVRGQGGGFYALDGSVKIKRSAFNSNTVEGSDTANLTDGAGLRFICFNGPMTVDLDEVTAAANEITDGIAIGGGISIANNSASLADGGSGLFPLTVNLSNSFILDNIVSSSIGMAGGAGIVSTAAFLAPTLNITNTFINNNTASSSSPGAGSFGGGVYGLDSIINISTSRINGNTAETGGGLCNTTDAESGMIAASMNVSSSSVDSNISTGNGGGIANLSDAAVSSSLFLKNVTLSGNRAGGAGGGIYQNEAAPGISTARANNSTIVSNRADSDGFGAEPGGGIFNGGGSFTIKNTIVGDNLLGPPPPDIKSLGTITGTELSGNFVSADYNLFEGTSGAVVTGPTINSIIGMDPNLEVLRQNGGLSRSHRPNAASPAIDAGDPLNCQDDLSTDVLYDQRGLPRDQGGARCDIGAIERGGFTWIGAGADNNFSTAENWDAGETPGSLDYIIFNSTNSTDINIDGAEEVRGVVFGGGYGGQMMIDGGELSVRDRFYLYGGNIICLNDGLLNMALNTSFVRHSGHVVGKINHDLLTNQSFLYPVGDGTGYFPVTINTTGFMAAGEKQPEGISSFSVEMKPGTMPSTNPGQTLNRYFTLESFGVPASDIIIEYQDNAVPATASEEAFNFIRRESGVNMAFAPSAGDSFFNTYRLNGVTAFSDWTLGQLAPTSAPVSIAGQVRSANGHGMRDALLKLSGGGLERPLFTRASSLGYYKFDGVAAGASYTVEVVSRRFSFSVAARLVSPVDNVSGVDFVAEP